MAMPNRHTAISALPAILIVHYFPTWWAWLVGILWAFWSHTIVDNICNEYWHRNTVQTMVAGGVLGVLFIASCAFMAINFGILVTTTMVVLALMHDIVDGILEKLNILPIFPTHFGSPYFIEPWFKEEAFLFTLLAEAAAAILIIYISFIL